MDKPTLQTRTATYFDWNDCVEYIQEKHNCNIRDFAGKFSRSDDEDPKADFQRPYLDYWHMVCNMAEPSDGQMMYMSDDWFTYGLEDWQTEITEWFLSEWGTGPEREITFLVEW